MLAAKALAKGHQLYSKSDFWRSLFKRIEMEGTMCCAAAMMLWAFNVRELLNLSSDFSRSRVLALSFLAQAWLHCFMQDAELLMYLCS